MISRITLNLRVTVYGPAQLDERTMPRKGAARDIPLTPLRSPRSRRFDPTESATQGLTVHVLTEIEDDSYGAHAWSHGEADTGAAFALNSFGQGGCVGDVGQGNLSRAGSAASAKANAVARNQRDSVESDTVVGNAV